MKFGLVVFLVLCSGLVEAEVRLPALFTDGLVLQSGKPVAVWGWAESGEEVSVSFGGQEKQAIAADGSWRIALDPMEPSAEPRSLTVKGKNEIVISDVLVGEVWICSGQSNMAMTVNESLDAAEEIAAANDPLLRVFRVPLTMADEPQADLLKKESDTAWLKTNPQSVRGFTAAGYFFGRELREALGVPVGLLHSSWGGTRAEAWTSQSALAAEPTCRAIVAGWEGLLAQYDAEAEKAKHIELKRPGGWEDLRVTRNRPSVLFNAMIAPIAPFTARGVIWYQGEGNHRRAVQYNVLLPAMIADWRKHWGDETLSFHLMQLAGFGNGKSSWPQPVGADDPWAELQWTQFLVARRVPHCGLAVGNDIGDLTNIHPLNKQEAGRRLALQALTKDYGRKGLAAGGPVFLGGERVKDRFVIRFDDGEGLKSRDGADLKGFIVCGTDRAWKTARAAVVAGLPHVEVWSEDVPEPVAVRYAWAAWCPEANLVNRDGLPAGLFRTDEFELSTAGVENPFAEGLAKPAPARAAAKGMISSDDYASIQEALDRNPGRMVFVPPGDHLIDRAILVATAGGGLWGSARLIQTNPEEPVVILRQADRSQVRDLTLTRPEGKGDTRLPALMMMRCKQATVANVQVLDNWTVGSAIRVEKCSQVVIRDCLVENYGCVTVEDWTKPAPNSGVSSGFAYTCSNGTGMDFSEVSGVLIQGNRIIESRLKPTPENRERYGFGKFTKKNATKGSHIDQKSWDDEYWYGWRQGSGIHVGSGTTSDSIQIVGNYLENSAQGIDIHADQVLVSNNIIKDASRGIKAMHGSRNVQIIGNQFSRCDHFAIGLMQGASSHEAGHLPNKGPAPVAANIDGHSLIADNIISDFGYGMEGWQWQSGGRHGHPIQIGGKSPLAETPPLRNIIVKGNVVHDSGRDQVLVEGKPKVEPPRYRYAVWVVEGAPADNPTGQGGFSNAPQKVIFADNLLDPGTEGVSNAEIGTASP